MKIQRLAALAVAGLFGAAHAATITIACGSSGNDVEFCQKHAEAWGKRTGNTVKHYSPPNNSTEALALYRQMFAAKAADVDVILMDIVWPGVLRDHLLDLSRYVGESAKQHFPAIVANNTVGGKVLGVPWYTDAGLLFYRKDLLDKYGLKVPTTWDEFTAAAQKVQDGERKSGNTDFQGFVFQGKAYEGLSCNALEWIFSHGGGTIVDADGKITVNNPNAAKALTMAAGWVGSIAPKGVLNYTEEEARGVFQNGKAAFMRNWPYAYALAEKSDSPIKGKIGVAPLPKQAGAARGAAALGGWNMAVSKYTKHADLAADLALYMANTATQKDRAIRGSFNPTRPELYRDADIARASPFMASLNEVFANAVARPTTVTGLKYPEVSQAFWDATHNVISGKEKAEDALKKLEARLTQIRRNKW